MPVSNRFIISCRGFSLLILILAANILDVSSFPYRSLFVGLLFSHFGLGFYYSKNNISLMKQKKYALILATGILLVGLYFSVFITHLAPYFLVVHVALSDAYLLKTRTKLKDPETMALFRTVFYLAAIGLAFIPMTGMAVYALSAIGLMSLAAIWFYSVNRVSLSLFELPLLAVALYAVSQGTTYDIHYLGFYHILTWYIFSFWMLFVKEQNTRKTLSFFSMVFLLSAGFVVFFDSVLNISITDKSFMKIIGTWSILHIFSSIPLSKFNPRFLKDLFYAS